MKLTDRKPHLDADALVSRFVPPPRFDAATFDTYVPDAIHPSQQAALDTMRAYGVTAKRKARSNWFRRRSQPPRAQGVYLDGGFGVGKTHLLASLFHASAGAKAYATFTELTAFIGFSGMAKATEALKQLDLICIDEFELDDVANTLMVVSYLRALSANINLRMAVTSNTLPDRLGEQRFSSQDFKREISAIASYFEELKIEGGDFRESHAASVVNAGTGNETFDGFDELLTFLRKLHPVQYGALLDDVSHVTISDIHTISDQDDALLFVQLIDKLYDANIQVDLQGVAVDAVFASRYRLGGYRKKYGRAESRMAAMQASRVQTQQSNP